MRNLETIFTDSTSILQEGRRGEFEKRYMSYGGKLSNRWIRVGFWAHLVLALTNSSPDWARRPKWRSYFLFANLIKLERAVTVNAQGLMNFAESLPQYRYRHGIMFANVLEELVSLKLIGASRYQTSPRLTSANPLFPPIPIYVSTPSGTLRAPG